MAAIRTLRPAVCSLRAATAQVSSRACLRPVVLASVPRPCQTSFRFKSDTTRSAFASNPVIAYDELKPITEQPSDNVLLIDVRERDENVLGSIPSAVNLPLSELKEALDQKYNPGDFQKKYAFPKPSYKQDIIFFCRSGKRSATASEEAGARGYHNVRNYVGSWLDWSKREKGSNQEDDD